MKLVLSLPEKAYPQLIKKTATSRGFAGQSYLPKSLI
jgi:hypothetical protein